MNSFYTKKANSKKDMLRELLRFLYFPFLSCLVILLSGCAPMQILGGTPDSLDPNGEHAIAVANLWWIMATLGTAVFLVVIAILLYGVYKNIRQRRALDLEIDRYPPDARQWIWIGGIIVPAIILAVVIFFSISTHAALADPAESPPVTIEVIGNQWFWEVGYPDEEIVTANEIHIPVGEPVQIRLATADVIHSFWVPELHGKMDLIPGRINSITIEAEEPGIYRGICAEFCGLQHAKMHFMVVAESPEEFASWVERERQPAPVPQDEMARRGQELFLNSTCVNCHAIRGTDATADIGPDLTHIASRLTIGAGVLENNRGNLAGWVVDPQHIKPGNLMPPTNLRGDELQALLAYLETLR